MIGYVTIGTNDMDKAKAYWNALLAPMGAKIIMDMGRIALLGTEPGAPMLGICTPYDEQPAHHGNGNMIAFAAASREQVDQLYAKAIELGGSDEGEPAAVPSTVATSVILTATRPCFSRRVEKTRHSNTGASNRQRRSLNSCSWVIFQRTRCLCHDG